MSKQRAKGTSFETAIVNWLLENGFPNARRNPLAGNKDKGDIAGLPVPLEAKNCKTMTLSTWMNEAQVEAKNAGAPFCPVVHKRRGVGDIAKQYVTMELGHLALLLTAYQEK